MEARQRMNQGIGNNILGHDTNTTVTTSFRDNNTFKSSIAFGAPN